MMDVSGDSNHECFFYEYCNEIIGCLFYVLDLCDSYCGWIGDGVGRFFPFWSWWKWLSMIQPMDGGFVSFGCFVKFCLYMDLSRVMKSGIGPVDCDSMFDRCDDGYWCQLLWWECFFATVRGYGNCDCWIGGDDDSIVFVLE